MALSPLIPRTRFPYSLSVALFAGALLVRLFRISEQNLWFDEYSTLEVASAPLRQLPSLMLSIESSKPPLYFAFIHYWLGLGGGEYWLRLPSALFGAFTCVVAAAIGETWFGRKGGLVLGGLLALAPFHVFYSQEARPYALWGLFMAAAFLCHIKFCQAPRLQLLIAYIALTVLASYTFLYGILTVGFSVLFSMTYRPRLSKNALMQLAVANILIVLLYIPWLVNVMSSVMHGVGFQPTYRAGASYAAAYSFFSLGLGSTFGPSMESLRLYGKEVFERLPWESALLILGFLLLIALVWIGAQWLWRMNRNALWFAVFGVLVFWGAPALFNAVRPDIPCNARYAFPAILFLLTLILAGCKSAIAAGGWQRGLVALFVLAAGTSLYNLLFEPQHARDDLRAAAAFVNRLEPPPERLLVCAGYLSNVFDYYYPGNVPIEAVMFMPKTEPETVLLPVTTSLAGVRRFALIYSRPDHGDPTRVLPKALEKQWRVTEMRHWTGVNVYVFDTPPDACNPERLRHKHRRHCVRLVSAGTAGNFPLCFGWAGQRRAIDPLRDERLVRPGICLP